MSSTGISPSLFQLPVMEQFYTLQGEGSYTGHAAYFIRLGGCDVGCVWCDVKDSWDAGRHPSVSVDEITTAAAQHPARIAVITGGEPLMYNLDALTAALRQHGFRIHIETSGAYPLSGNPDWICVSPKKFKAPLAEVLQAAHELKVVVYNKSDFAWAEQQAAHTNPQCRLFLQPEWGKQQEQMPGIIGYVKQHTRWQVSLQTHKYLNIP